jgi:carboxymethylenebutenolidase
VILLEDRGAEATATAARARRLASHGYFVLAPQAPDDPVEEAFDAWLDYLAGERLTDDGRIGALGYGAGAGLGLQLAAIHGERIAALAAFHPAAVAAESVHHLAGCLNAVVHLGYAAQDTNWRTQDAQTLEAELRRAGVDFEVELYSAAAGFATPGGAGHDLRAAELHWARLVELFRRTLKVQTADTTADLAGPSP